MIRKFKYLGNYSQSYTYPQGFRSVTLKVWGAGGGGDKYSMGGPGGYCEAIFLTAPGNVLDIYVGQGGLAGINGGTASFGGGGTGGLDLHDPNEPRRGASGGGASFARALVGPIILAGGGGGAGGYSQYPYSDTFSNGGSGGGINGTNAYTHGSINWETYSKGGKGGTQNSGGIGGTGYYGTEGQNGYQYGTSLYANGGQGGSGAPDGGVTNTGTGGGGGGGFCGGGGGAGQYYIEKEYPFGQDSCQEAAGGGGSGFIYSIAVSGIKFLSTPQLQTNNITDPNLLPPNTTDADYDTNNWYGKGGIFDTNGRDGFVVIVENLCISGYVFDDANHNGIFDAGESGIPNVRIYMKDTEGNCVSASTDSNGKYLFNFVNKAGTYIIYETAETNTACPPTQYAQPSGFTHSTTFRKYKVIISQSTLENATANGFEVQAKNFGHDNPVKFDCQTNLYLLKYISDTSKAISIINFVTGRIINEITVSGGFSGLGYNIQDDVLYAISDSSHLIRIISDGTTTDYGPIDYLNQTSFTASAMDDAGHLYIYYDPFSFCFAIDTNQNSQWFGSMVDPATGFSGRDEIIRINIPSNFNSLICLTYNTSDSFLYGIVDIPPRLVKWNTVTNVSEVVLSSTQLPSATGSFLMCDSDGTVYSAQISTNYIYRYNSTKGDTDFQLFSQLYVASEIYISSANCITSDVSMDFGDAPSTYRTLLEDNGARHQMTASSSSNLTLGTAITCEYDAHASLDAEGDDLINNVQDDGITQPLLPVYISDTSYHLDVSVNNNSSLPANLYAWIDFNQNNIFELDEVADVVVIPPLSTGQSWRVNFSTLPVNIFLGDTILRLRLTTDTLSNTNSLSDEEDTRSFGPASDGEVEDYIIKIIGSTTPKLLFQGNSLSQPVAVGGTISYSVSLSTQDGIGILNAVFTNPAPAGTNFIPGSFRLVHNRGYEQNAAQRLSENTAMHHLTSPPTTGDPLASVPITGDSLASPSPSYDPTVGVNLGNIPTNTNITVTYSFAYTEHTCCYAIGNYAIINYSYIDPLTRQRVNLSTKSNVTFTGKQCSVLTIPSH